MFILKLTLKSCLSKWKRFAIFICLTVLLSYLIGLLGNYFLYKDKAVDPITVVIVNLDSSTESTIFLNSLTDSKQFGDFLIFENKTEQEAELMLQQNIATAVFTIPKDFATYIKNGENQPFSAVYNSSMPIKVALVEYFANGLTQILMSSQIGVYTALDYAWENGTEKQYNTLFRTTNVKYLTTVMGRNKILSTVEVSVINTTSPFQYYFFGAYIFIMLAGMILFVDILHDVFTKETLIRLRLMGVSSFKITASAVLSIFVALCIVNGIFGAFIFFSKDIAEQMYIDKQIIIGLSIILLCISAFTVLISQVFKNVFSAGVFVSLFSIITLFVSGGIIPIDYLSASINTMSRFTINYWGVKLLSGSVALPLPPQAENIGIDEVFSAIENKMTPDIPPIDYNNIKMLLLFILVYFVLSFIIFKMKARVGDTV